MFPFTPRKSPSQLYRKKMKMYSFNNHCKRKNVRKLKVIPVPNLSSTKTSNLNVSSFKKSTRSNLSGRQKGENARRLPNVFGRRNNSTCWETPLEIEINSGMNYRSEMSHKQVQSKARQRLVHKPKKINNFSVNLYQNCGRTSSRTRKSSKNTKVGLF